MVISNIKLGFARKKVADLPRKSGSSKGAYPRGNACIILDEDDTKLIKKFSKLGEDLGIQEQDFKIVLCLPSPPKKIDFDGLVFSLADVDWKGNIKNPEIKDLLCQEFGLLVSFVRKESRAVNFITEAVHANFKANRQVGTSSKFDLTISTDYVDAEVFITELKKYLKILNTIQE